MSQLVSRISGNLYEFPPLSPELQTYVAGINIWGQKRRLALSVLITTILPGWCDMINVRLAWLLMQKAQARDIDFARIILSTFKKMVVKIQGVLEAEKVEQLPHVNAEDSQRLEKDDERHRERKQKGKRPSRETS